MATAIVHSSSNLRKYCVYFKIKGLLQKRKGKRIYCAKVLRFLGTQNIRSLLSVQKTCMDICTVCTKASDTADS